MKCLLHKSPETGPNADACENEAEFLVTIFKMKKTEKGRYVRDGVLLADLPFCKYHVDRLYQDKQNYEVKPIAQAKA